MRSANKIGNSCVSSGEITQVLVGPGPTDQASDKQEAVYGVPSALDSPFVV